MTKIKSGFFDSFETGDEDTSKVEETVEDIENTEEDSEDDELEEEEEEQDTDESDEGYDDDSDPFIDTINFFSEKGLLQFDEDKIYEEEGEELLETVFNETLNKRFQEEYIDSIPEEYQSIIQHLKSGGSLDEWVEAVKPTNYDSINIEDETNQMALIEDHLRLTGMDDDDIKERIQELEDLGTLEKNAKTAIKYLKKNEEGRIKEYEQELATTVRGQEQAQAQLLENFKQSVLATEELKGGFRLKDKKERQALLDYITEPTNNKGESRYVIDNKSQEAQLTLAYMSMKGFSFEDLETAIETKVTSGLRKSLSRITDTNARGVNGRTGRENTESKKIPKGPWG